MLNEHQQLSSIMIVLQQHPSLPQKMSNRSSSEVMISILDWCLLELVIVKVVCLNIDGAQILMLECGVLQRKADLLTRQWIMMLTCSSVRWTKSLQCWGEKSFTYISLCFSVGRLRWSRRTRPTWRRRPSSTAKNKHTCKTRKHQKDSWKSQNNTLTSHISCVYFRVQEESEEKREKLDPLVLLGPPDLKDLQEMMVLKEALYVLTSNHLFGVWKKTLLKITLPKGSSAY